MCLTCSLYFLRRFWEQKVMTCLQITEDNSRQSEYHRKWSRINFGNHLIFSQNLTLYIRHTYSGTLRKICCLEGFTLNYLWKCWKKYRNFECYNFLCSDQGMLWHQILLFNYYSLWELKGYIFSVLLPSKENTENFKKYLINVSHNF